MKFITTILAMAITSIASAQVISPNGKVEWREKGKGFAVVYHDGNNECEVLDITNVGMLMKDGGGKELTLKAKMPVEAIKDSYTMVGGKRHECSNEANEVTYLYIDNIGRQQQLIVRAYNDGVAFRYALDGLQHTRPTEELTAYRIAEGTKRWMQKWTEPYEAFFPLSTTGENENKRWGYPALIQSADNVFALITEAGIERFNSASSLYNDRNKEEYRVVLDENQQNTTGQWLSPWRVVIVGELKDVVASTLVTDVSDPCRIEDTSWIKPGSVSWIYWAYNHGSNDYQIVRKYVDMAVEMHWPYVLIDAEWDEMKNGGNIEDAIRYAHDKGVKPILWYNSSTAWIKAWGAPGPHERLNAPENREREFVWLEKMGVAGVKIDFFAGDKQPTIQLYEEILSDANDNGLMVIFHGCTIPRGWERMYPNYVGSEAVLASENLYFTQRSCDMEALNTCLHPFIRNAIGCMEFGGCFLSRRLHREPNKGNYRKTTDVFELATTVLFQNPIQNFALVPNNISDAPAVCIDYMKQVPTTWDETVFIDGYPGKYVVMARRNGDKWYLAAVNATGEPLKLNLDLPMFKGREVQLYSGGNNPSVAPVKVKAKGLYKVTIPSQDGMVMVTK